MSFKLIIKVLLSAEYFQQNQRLLIQLRDNIFGRIKYFFQLWFKKTMRKIPRNLLTLDFVLTIMFFYYSAFFKYC